MITEKQPVGTGPSSVIIGRYSHGPSRGPNGGRWLPGPHGQLIQTVTEQLYNAVIVVHNQHVPCRNARQSDLELLNATLELVPPLHLKLVLEHRPAGIRVSESRDRQRHYTGGANPRATTRSGAIYDDPSTLDFVEGMGILITFGALFNFARLGISPTVFHEFGHQMFNHHKLNVTGVDLSGTSHSSSAVAGIPTEGICDAYMYMLCYGASDSGIHGFGNRGDILRCRSTREVLRRCRAFNDGDMMDSEWLARYAER